MALRILDDLSVRNTPGVSTAGTSIIDVNSGGLARSYYAIHLEHKRGSSLATQAQIETDIKEIRVLINNNVQWKVKPRHLFDIQALYGKAFTNGSIPLLFAYPWSRTVQSEDLMSLGMLNVKDFRVEVEYTGDQPAHSLSAVAEYDNTAKDLVAMMIMNYQSIPVAAGGINSLLDLPVKGAYSALHLFEDEGASNFDILDVEITVDGRIVRDVTDSQNTSIIKRHGFAPVATDVFHIPFSFDARPTTSALSMVRQDGSRVGEFKVDANVNFTGADTLEAVYEVWKLPEL